MSDQNPFSAESLRQTIQNLPPEQGGIGVVKTETDAGVVGALKRDPGAPGGFWFGATGQYWQRSKDYAAALWVGWTGKKT